MSLVSAIERIGIIHPSEVDNDYLNTVKKYVELYKRA